MQCLLNVKYLKSVWIHFVPNVFENSGKHRQRAERDRQRVRLNPSFVQGFESLPINSFLSGARILVPCLYFVDGRNFGNVHQLAQPFLVVKSAFPFSKNWKFHINRPAQKKNGRSITSYQILHCRFTDWCSSWSILLSCAFHFRFPLNV